MKMYVYILYQYYLLESSCDITSFYYLCSRTENIHTYKETARISFYFVVTDPANSAVVIPKAEVEAAIR